MDIGRDGASVVVGARESRVQGEGKQGADGVVLTEERSMDMDHRADTAWLLGVQRKLYQWSKRQRLRSPWFLESRMHNERCTSGSVRGRRKPTAAEPHGADVLLNRT